jgi:hypothetical protein
VSKSHESKVSQSQGSDDKEEMNSINRGFSHLEGNGSMNRYRTQNYQHEESPMPVRVEPKRE